MAPDAEPFSAGRPTAPIRELAVEGLRERWSPDRGKWDGSAATLARAAPGGQRCTALRTSPAGPPELPSTRLERGVHNREPEGECV